MALRWETDEAHHPLSGPALPLAFKSKSLVIRGRNWSDLHSVFVSVLALAMHFYCALWFCSALPCLVWFWCTVVQNFPSVPQRPPWFTLLLLSHTDKFFTPHERRLLPAERRLSALCSLLSIVPSLSVFAFLPLSCFHPHVICIPSLVQNPRIFLHCVRNKHPSFYVSCISLLCPFFFFFISIYFHVALIKPGSLDFKLCL